MTVEVPAGGGVSARGLLVAFEGLDQSGKQTQAERLRDRLTARGRSVRLLSFPDYATHIGTEIGLALRGEREYPAEVMQMLYIANRYEWKAVIEAECARGGVVICDRYLASSVAYGEAQGLDPAWLRDAQRYLPAPDLTVLLDIAPEVSARRKTSDRDRYERDLALLGRVRESYLRQAAQGWMRLDADQDRGLLADTIAAAVAPLLD
jgi:dTMP kinase